MASQKPFFDKQDEKHVYDDVFIIYTFNRCKYEWTDNF